MTNITIVGNLGGDPELRFTPSGAAVANASVAVTARKLVNGEWEDGDTSWYRLNIWNGLAENAAEALVKGDRVIVQGDLSVRPYDDKDGNERLSVEVTVRDIGLALRHAEKKDKPKAAAARARR